MKTSKFEKLKNNTIVASYLVLTIFISIYGYLSYYFDMLSFNKLLIVIGVTSIPMLITSLINFITKSTSNMIKYIIIFSFAFTYTLLTYITNLEYMYVIAILMLMLIIIYQERRLLLIFSVYTMLINFFVIYVSINEFSFANVFTVENFIQIFAVLFAAIIIDLLTQTVKYSSDVTSELSDYILKDRLTGAFNRNFIIDNIIFDKKSKNGINLAFIDIDDFKYLNDNYGHDYGDMVLQEFASIIMNKIAVEKAVYLVRIGGDEFLIVGIDMIYSDFVKLIDSIKDKVIKTTFSKNKINTYIRISVGITTTNECTSGEFEELYKKADDRLYQAKRQGKNQIVYK